MVYFYRYNPKPIFIRKDEELFHVDDLKNLDTIINSPTPITPNKSVEHYYVILWKNTLTWFYKHKSEPDWEATEEITLIEQFDTIEKFNNYIHNYKKINAIDEILDL